MDFPHLRNITDPADRIRAATEALPQARDAILAIRRDAVLEMRETMTLAEIADILGVTRSWVAQMENPHARKKATT